MATEWIKAQCEINFGLSAAVFGLCGLSGLIESVHERSAPVARKKNKKVVDPVISTTGI